ncbi:sirohydrochlorin chelatase [Allostreptomyces psammosilenae]|uniref:Sirohydrochlorin ferrochelatase n=1 Tax=Allostreptomyces psammosilenae TaxID=1892865 RepID=A0A852ZSD3_9ACTN|nr:CbiX/SirB N-terminal domain-containing protein [Allostreptomyces psammosilenae]NYI05346.1 sirohydrochlorin ferrochelatase [Allostreptomyces psammosilenae]
MTTALFPPARLGAGRRSIPSRPTVLLVAHGTRHPGGAPVAEALARAVGERHGLPWRVAYVDVHGPTIPEALADVPGPVVVLPAFLASGYHVRVDIPEQLALAGRRIAAGAAPATAAVGSAGGAVPGEGVPVGAVPVVGDSVSGAVSGATDAHGGTAVVADAIGPHPLLLRTLRDRLREAGARPRDAVVLAAAGSSDHSALAEVASVADGLGRRLGRPVPVGYAATATPSVPEAVARLREAGARRVSVASWLLAPGLFADRLAAAGADAVAAPLGDHRAVVDVLTERLTAAWATTREFPTPALRCAG